MLKGKVPKHTVVKIYVCVAARLIQYFFRLFKGTAMAKPKQRLVADPSIGVADLLQCIECWLDEKGASSILKELEPPSGTGWKTAVDPSWITKLGGLWKKFIANAPNGVIPSKKNRTALEKLQDRRQVNQGKRNPQDFAELCDEWIRIGLAQLRSCKQSQLIRARTMRKAGPDEQEMINDLISMLAEVPEENEETATPPKPDPVPVAKASAPSGQVPAPTTQQGVSDQGEDVDPLSVFEAINKKEALGESPTKVITSPIASRRPSSSSGSPWKFDGFATGLKAMGYLTEEDQTIMARCSNQRPINLGSSTQLQRANKAEKQQQEEEDQEEKKETTVSTKTGGKVFKPEPKKKHLTTKPKAKAKAKALPKKKKTKQGVEKTLPSSTLIKRMIKRKTKTQRHLRQSQPHLMVLILKSQEQ